MLLSRVRCLQGFAGVLATAVLLCGCSTWRCSPRAGCTNYAVQQRDLLVYAHGADALSDSQLQTKVGKVRKQFSASPTAYNRLQLAILLMVPGHSSTDYGTAEKLLSKFLKQNGQYASAASLVPLAHYLLDTARAQSNAIYQLVLERKKRQTLEEKIQEITTVIGHSQHRAERINAQ